MSPDSDLGPESGPDLGLDLGPEPGFEPDRLPGRLRTALALLAVDAGLRLFGFRRMSALLGGDTAAPEPAAAPDLGRQDASPGASAGTPSGALTGGSTGGLIGSWAVALARRVEQAAGFRVYRVPCLPRALLLRHWLAARGLPATLRIGARRDGRLLRAHAWVECGGRVLDPDPAVGERFPPLEG